MEQTDGHMEESNLTVDRHGRRQYKEMGRAGLCRSHMDMALYLAGSESCRAGQDYGPRVRPYHLIHFVMEGSGTLDADGTRTQVGAGDAFLIPADHVAYYAASQSTPWSYMWVGFFGIQSSTYMHQLMSAAPDAHAIRHVNIARCADAIEELLQPRPPAPSARDFLLANSILLRVLSYLLEEVPMEEPPRGPASIADEMRLYLDMNYPKSLSMKAVAEEFGFHPNYMARVFRERFGVSPKRYVQDLKLKKACGLLASTELPVAAIAYSLGFTDPLAFSKFFRNGMGESPSSYRIREALQAT